MFTTNEKENLAKQYTPLVHKIAKQLQPTTPLTYDDCIGYGYEGLIKAMNKFDEGKNYSFKNFAAYHIRWMIMNRSTSEGHTVKFSSYQQEKAKKEGRPTFIMKSIDTWVDDNGDMRCNIDEPSTEPVYPNETFKLLDDFMKANFSERNIKIFCMVYGLHNYKVHTTTDVAREFGVSGPCIALNCKRMISKIKNDPELVESLASLL